MLNKLSKHYKVYAIDFIGTGSSSHCKYDIKNTEESIDFCVEKLDL